MTVLIWSKHHCPQCEKTKDFLEQKGIAFEERKIGDGWTREDLLEVLPNARSVPQIFINNSPIGGYDNLLTYIEETGFNGTGQII